MTTPNQAPTASPPDAPGAPKKAKKQAGPNINRAGGGSILIVYFWSFRQKKISEINKYFVLKVFCTSQERVCGVDCSSETSVSE